MNCAICGKIVPEGSAACSHCGTQMSPADGAWMSATPGDGAQPSVVQAAEPLPGEFRASQPDGGSYVSGDSSGAAPDSGSPRRPAPRRRRTALIVIAGVLVVLIAGGFIAYQVFGRDIRRQLMGPTKSYLMIEGQALKGSMDRLAGGIAESVNQADKPAGMDTTMSFKLAAPLPGIDANVMRTINSLKLQTRSLIDRKATGPKMYTKTDILTGSEQLLSLELFAEENQMTVGSPGLIPQYIAVPVGNGPVIPGASEPGDLTDAQSLLGFLKLSFDRAPLVDKVQLAGSLNKLANVFLANIDRAEFTDGATVTAGGISVPYECYIMTSNGRQLRDMAVGALELVRDEKPLHDLVYPYFRDSNVSGFGGMAFTFGGFAPAAGTSPQPMSESDFKAKLNEAIDRLKNAKDSDLQDLSFTQKVYVDKQDRIHGRELNVMKTSTKQFVDLKVLAPVSDGRHGLLVGLMTDGKDTEPLDLQFTANYEEKDGLKTGNGDLLANGTTPLTVTYRGMGYQSDGTGARLVGEIDFNADAKALEVSMPIPKVTFKGALNGSRYVMDFNAANLATLTVEQARVPAADVKIPSLSGKTIVQASDESLNSLMTLDVQMKLMAILQKLNLDPSTLF